MFPEEQNARRLSECKGRWAYPIWTLNNKALCLPSSLSVQMLQWWLTLENTWSHSDDSDYWKASCPVSALILGLGQGKAVERVETKHPGMVARAGRYQGSLVQIARARYSWSQYHPHLHTHREPHVPYVIWIGLLRMAMWKSEQWSEAHSKRAGRWFEKMVSTWLRHQTVTPSSNSSTTKC